MGFGSHTPKAQKLLESLGHRGAALPPPDSSLQTHRLGVGLSQPQLAQKTGVAQSLIAQIETGDRRMTAETAVRLAPALGITPEDLVHDEMLSTLQRTATKGQLDPERLADGILNFAEAAPPGMDTEALIAEMIEVLRRAARTYGKGVGTKGVGARAQAAPRRDAQGQRVDKPYALDAKAQPEEQRDPLTGRRERDAMGRVIKKPHDPKQGGGRL